VDAALAARIMQRCTAVCPALGGGRGAAGLSVVRHAVGLRPMREGGPRVELERITLIVADDTRRDGEDGRVHGLGDPNMLLPVVHCYGHGGSGYQSSWGSARMVLDLVRAALG
jgi:D-amino-acid oxidase